MSSLSYFSILRTIVRKRQLNEIETENESFSGALRCVCDCCLPRHLELLFTFVNSSLNSRN